MTIAPWTSAGRALALALLLLSLALPAAAQGAPGGDAAPRTALEGVLARDEHRRIALAPARRALARKRAQLRRVLTPPAPERQVAEPRRPKTAEGSSAAAKPDAGRKPAERGASKPAAGRKPGPAAERKASKPAKPAAPAPVPDSRYDEDKALELPADVEVGQARTDAGGSLGRTLFGLMIVVGLIYGLTIVLRRMRNGALGGAAGRSQGLKAVASIPLGPNRSIHLVRAGAEYLLVGAAEHGVVPLRTYSEDEARAAGLLDLDGGVAKQAVTKLEAVRRERSGPKLDLSTLVDDLRTRTVRR